MKVLVSGGGGFIGGALITKMPLKHSVVSVDHGRNYPYLRKVAGNNVLFKKGNFQDHRILDRLTPDTDVIVHLGAIAGERLCIANPQAALISNVYATDRLLECSAKYKIKKFVFASSYWVYPTFRKTSMPLKESDCPEVTDSFYGMLKLCSERLVKQHCPFGAILRFATVYGFGSGVGSQWRGIVGKYILKAFRGEPLIVFGDGSQKIDLIHVDDVVKVLINLIEQKFPGNLSLNVGSGAATSVLEIAYIVKKLAKKHFGITSKLKKVKAPQGKVWPDKWLSINKIKKHIPAYPSVGLEEGVLEMMQKLYRMRENENSIYKTILQS